MIKKQITLVNKFGLHTRAAAKLVTLAKKYSAKVQLVLNGKPADCKSIMALILLGARMGTVFELVVDGEDERDAMKAVALLIKGKFGEPE